MPAEASVGPSSHVDDATFMLGTLAGPQLAGRVGRLSHQMLKGATRDGDRKGGDAQTSLQDAMQDNVAYASSLVLCPIYRHQCTEGWERMACSQQGKPVNMCPVPLSAHHHSLIHSHQWRLG